VLRGRPYVAQRCISAPLPWNVVFTLTDVALAAHLFLDIQSDGTVAEQNEDRRDADKYLLYFDFRNGGVCGHQ
jgi:hypothetical protein